MSELPEAVITRSMAFSPSQTWLFEYRRRRPLPGTLPTNNLRVKFGSTSSSVASSPVAALTVVVPPKHLGFAAHHDDVIAQTRLVSTTAVALPCTTVT